MSLSNPAVKKSPSGSINIGIECDWAGKSLAAIRGAGVAIDDDHAHRASSERKKLTERYRLTDPDSLEMEITVEDSLFLTEPYTWTRRLRRSEYPPGDWGDCDLETSRRQLSGLRSKYDE